MTLLSGVLSGVEYGPYERYGFPGIILPATFSGLYSTVDDWLGTKLALRLDITTEVFPRIEPLNPRTAAEREQEASIEYEHDGMYLIADVRLISFRQNFSSLSWDIQGAASFSEEDFPNITDEELAESAFIDLESKVDDARTGQALDLADLKALADGKKVELVGIDEAFMRDPMNGKVFVKLKPAGQQLLAVWLDQMLEQGRIKS